MIDERFETCRSSEVGFVTCRALERFDEMLPRLLHGRRREARCCSSAQNDLQPRIENEGYEASAELMPGSKAGFLFVVNKMRGEG